MSYQTTFGGNKDATTRRLDRSAIVSLCVDAPGWPVRPAIHRHGVIPFAACPLRAPRRNELLAIFRVLAELSIGRPCNAFPERRKPFGVRRLQRPDLRV